MPFLKSTILPKTVTQALKLQQTRNLKLVLLHPRKETPVVSWWGAVGQLSDTINRVLVDEQTHLTQTLRGGM